MEKAITTGLLTIASIVAVMALINAVIPAIGKSSGALLNANSEASDRIRTDIEIIHASGDTGTNKVTLWVKNIGSTKIEPITANDIILTTPTEVKRLPYGSGGEYWEYTIENGSEWTQAVTVKITLNLTSVTTGTYSVTVAVYNSVSDSKDFSV